jgi:hypothetical protein
MSTAIFFTVHLTTLTCSPIAKHKKGSLIKLRDIIILKTLNTIFQSGKPRKGKRVNIKSKAIMAVETLLFHYAVNVTFQK